MSGLGHSMPASSTVQASLDRFRPLAYFGDCQWTGEHHHGLLWTPLDTHGRVVPYSRFTMDAFIQAAEDARARLIRQRGRAVSWRELIAQAGYTEGQRASVAYHLNRKRRWPKGHNVPPEMVERLSKVLPISHEELARAAQVAAGFNLAATRPDLTVIARFLEADHVPDNEKAEIVAQMARLVADTVTRRPA